MCLCGLRTIRMNFSLFSEIYLQLNGIGKCQWSEQRRKFIGEETYLKQITQLVHPSTDGMDISKFSLTIGAARVTMVVVVTVADKPFAMAPGVYTYKFQCDLPKELPTSCEEKFGFIRYLASAHILLQPLSADKVHSVAFTVIKPYNLNAEPIFKVSSGCAWRRMRHVRKPPLQKKTNTTNVIFSFCSGKT